MIFSQNIHMDGAFPSEFGHFPPRNLVAWQLLRDVSPSGKLASGDKIADGLSVHWGNGRANVDFVHEDDRIAISTTGTFGDFLSITWNFDLSFLEEIAKEYFVSLGFDEIYFEGVEDQRQVSSLSSVYLQRGKHNVKDSNHFMWLDGRFVASHLIGSRIEYWAQSHQPWIDAVFYGQRFKSVVFKGPKIWMQKTV